MSDSGQAPLFNCVAPSQETVVRHYVEHYFEPADVGQAMEIAWCESRYTPTAANPTSTARGVFQQLRGWWSGEWGTFGAFDPFDVDRNVAHAAYLRANNGWSDWASSSGCWQ